MKDFLIAAMLTAFVIGMLGSVALYQLLPVSQLEETAVPERITLNSPVESEKKEASPKAAVREKIRSENAQEIECLALNIYHEARGSSFVDRAAVTDVVLNRVQDTRYPNSVCSVVKQARMSKWHLENTGKRVPVRHKCQFSWYCDGKSDEPQDNESWQHAKHLAYNMYYYDQYRGITEGATHYHATYVSPNWANHFQLVGRIGDHVFYRWVN